MTSFIRQELIQLIFEITDSDAVLTGAEEVISYVKKATATGGVPDDSVAPALVLTSAFTPAAGAVKAFWTFSGSTAGLARGKYVQDAWVKIAGTWVSLGGCDIEIRQNVTVVT